MKISYVTAALIVTCVMASISVITFTAHAQETCVDSDGGLNYSVKGGASRGNTPPYTDSCYCPINRNLTNLGACTEGPFVGEWFCNASGYTEMKKQECQNGCRDGACVIQTSSGCGDNILDASKGEECDYGTENGKNGWCTTQCMLAPCTDTDGGNNEFQKGITRSGFGETTSAEDGCSADGMSVYEAYCSENIITSSVLIPCANGCQDGACTQDSNICTDTDGKDPYKKGFMTSTELNWKNAEEYCATPNHDATNSYSYSSSCSGDDCFVFEYSCTDAWPHTDAIRCSQGCNNGACRREPSPTISCGNGRVEGNETCDDGHYEDGDGCSGKCTVEKGWYCFGTCNVKNDDWIIAIGAEDCDDGNMTHGDGCHWGKIEKGWSCRGEPSACQRDGSDEEAQNGTPSAGYEDEVRVINRQPSSKHWFRDMSIGTLEADAANFLAQNGIIGGFPDGTFRESNLVNRAEAAKFLMLARFRSVDNRMNNGRFWDIPDGEWYVRYVMKAADLGIINGHPDGSFRPQDPVKAGEFLKMLALTFGLQENLPYPYADVAASDWYARYAGIATKYGIIPSNFFCEGEDNCALLPGRELTRGEVAIAIYKILVATTDDSL